MGGFLMGNGRRLLPFYFRLPGKPYNRRGFPRENARNAAPILVFRKYAEHGRDGGNRASLGANVSRLSDRRVRTARGNGPTASSPEFRDFN